MKIFYIDMQNIHKSTEEMGWIIDWQLFYDYLDKKFAPDRVIMFVGYIQKYKHFYDKLATIGYTMNFKEVLIRTDGSIKGDVDIDIAIQAMKDIHTREVTQAYLVSGDADYNTLINEWIANGVFGKLIVPQLDKILYILRKASGSRLQPLTDIRHLIQKQKDPPKSES